MTKKEMFAVVKRELERLEFEEKAEVLIWIEKELTKSVEKKVNVEVEKFRHEIFSFLTTHSGEKFTCGELNKAMNLEASTSKISNALNTLAKEGKIEKVMEKNKAYFLFE